MRAFNCVFGIKVGSLDGKAKDERPQGTTRDTGKPTPFIYITRDGESLEQIESGYGSGIRAQLKKMINADVEVTT